MGNLLAKQEGAGQPVGGSWLQGPGAIPQLGGTLALSLCG